MSRLFSHVHPFLYMMISDEEISIPNWHERRIHIGEHTVNLNEGPSSESLVECLVQLANNTSEDNYTSYSDLISNGDRGGAPIYVVRDDCLFRDEQGNGRNLRPQRMPTCPTQPDLAEIVLRVLCETIWIPSSTPVNILDF